MNEKFLYETTIDKVIETPDITSSIDAQTGEKVEIKKIVKSLTKIKIAILKPDRKLFKAAEIFYAKSLADYLRAGLLPYSLVAKRYANDGGPLSDEDKKRIEELKNKAAKLEQDFFTKKDTSQQNDYETLLQLNQVNIELSKIQSAFSDIYESTAEMKARNDTIEWWSAHLCYINENNDSYKPIFQGDTYEEKLSKLDYFDNLQDEFYSEAIKRLSFLISFWLNAKNSNITTKDFEGVDKLYLQTSSSYHPEEKIKDSQPKDNEQS